MKKITLRELKRLHTDVRLFNADTELRMQILDLIEREIKRLGYEIEYVGGFITKTIKKKGGK